MRSTVAREQADQNIEADVTTVNQTLNQLAQNEAALAAGGSQRRVHRLLPGYPDQLLSTLSQHLPIKVYQESNNGIMVTTDGGTTLSTAACISFRSRRPRTSRRTCRRRPIRRPAYSGGLSAVTVDGQPIAMSQSGEHRRQSATARRHAAGVRPAARSACRQHDHRVPTGRSDGQQRPDRHLHRQRRRGGSHQSSADPWPGGQHRAECLGRSDAGRRGLAHAWTAPRRPRRERTGDNSTVLAFIQALNTDAIL